MVQEAGVCEAPQDREEAGEPCAGFADAIASKPAPTKCVFQA